MTFIRTYKLQLLTAAIFLVVVGLWLLGHHEAGLALPAMAYPTTLAFQDAEAGRIGGQAMTLTDTTQRHPLGTKARFVDPTYGEIECVYLKGVAATAAGDVVSYDPKLATTTRALAATRGPMAIAMSANVALQFGWYAIRGTVPVSSTLAGTGAANSGIQTSAVAGQATVSGTAGQKISGARCTSVQDAPGANFTDVLLHYPTANGDT